MRPDLSSKDPGAVFAAALETAAAGGLQGKTGIAVQA
jgi:hypothetical protein